MTSEHEPTIPLDEQKEIKVKIPLDYHVKLHTLKVLRGQQISKTVSAALGWYFERLSQEEKGRQLEELSQDAVESLL